jgi:HD-like signal output (HDOD) protein
LLALRVQYGHFSGFYISRGKPRDSDAAVWSETAEFHLEPGEVEHYYTRKSSEALRLYQGYNRVVGYDWARKWGLPNDLCHMYEKKSKKKIHQVMNLKLIICRAREKIWRK